MTKLLPGVVASGISGHLWAPVGAYEQISSTTVDITAVASITFSGIPQTYQHLQVRLSARSGSNDDLRYRLNGDTGGNYSRHLVYGNGSGAATGSSTSSTVGSIGNIDNTANIFSAGILDILDYTNTNKYTTSRSLNGYETGSSGVVILFSTAWMNTAAVNSITIFPQSSSFQQYSTFALYGVN